MKQIIITLLMIASWGIHAETSFPYGCKPMTMTGSTVKLPAKAPGLVLIRNVSESDLWITHPITDPSASAGWSSRLQASRWSAFALGPQAFELSCIESKPGHEQQVSCTGVLAICEWHNIKSTDKVPPPYWASENMTLPALQAHIGQRGFTLPEPTKE